MNNQELTYWLTLSLIPKITTKRKNEIYANCFTNETKISIIDLFEKETLWDTIGLTNEEKIRFTEAKSQLSNNSFLIEDLLSQGYDILPITSTEYPQLLKHNLKYNSPIVIYTKGNKSLLQKPTIAIVGSRNADSKSLTFTDTIARKAVLKKQVIVSGFAKGVDRQALDSAISENGKSIIVLPQGIMTFKSGFKQYYKDIISGNVLVISTFAPNVPWAVELAMARNAIIYGLASEIYVSQSDSKGGTWAGVIDGLNKDRLIYVRYPDKEEHNANLLLIEKGAIAIDNEGNPINKNNESDSKNNESINIPQPNIPKKSKKYKQRDVDIQLTLFNEI